VVNIKKRIGLPSRSPRASRLKNQTL
jgi:hypothetical protein